MFKEIESELLSIISEDPIDKIAHTPSIQIAKTMDLLYNIKFESIQKVYTENMDKLIRMVVVYKSEKRTVDQDLCTIDGKLYHITFFPYELLDKSENNAITLTKSILYYISLRLGIIMDNYDNIISEVQNSTFKLINFQSIPVITCAVVRKIYSGNLSKIIYMTLSELFSVYKKAYSEQGITDILNLFDEGLDVNDLLDNGFICSIKPGDKNYPGIWTKISEE